MGAEEILFFLYVSVVLSHAFEYHACRKRVFLLCLVTLPFKSFFFFLDVFTLRGETSFQSLKLLL